MSRKGTHMNSSTDLSRKANPIQQAVKKVFGFPEMGIKGAAIGTLTARSLEFLIVLFYVAKIDKKVRVFDGGLLRGTFTAENRKLCRDFIIHSCHPFRTGLGNFNPYADCNTGTSFIRCDCSKFRSNNVLSVFKSNSSSDRFCFLCSDRKVYRSGRQK